MGADREILFYDVCVIGGAGAGLSAGLRAKENGAGKVLIIDKMKNMGVCTSGWANNGYAYMGTCLGSSLFGGYSAGKLAAEEAMKQA